MRFSSIILLGLFLLAAAAGGGWFAMFGGAVDVTVERVKQDPIQEFIDEQGKTRLPQTYLITMPYTGRIEAIGLTEGTPVTAGQSVARIVPLDLQLNVDAATAAVKRLHASIAENDDASVEKTGLKQSLKVVESVDATVAAAQNRVTAGQRKKDFAESQLKRVQETYEKKQTTQEELERAEVEEVQSQVDFRQDELVLSSMKAIQAATMMLPTMIQQYITRKDLSRGVLLQQVEEARAKLDQVLEDQRRGTLLSPVTGVVLARQATNERYLTAGTVLLEIGRLEDLQVEAEVLSQDVVRVKAGNPVSIYGPAIGEPAAAGIVDKIFPAGFTKVSSLGVEQQRVKVIVNFRPDDLARVRTQQGLGVDYRVRVKITTAAKSSALVVPRTALFRGLDGQWQVFAVRDGRAVQTNIEVGLKNDTHVEVLKGLSQGDLVIPAPESHLTNGTRVKYTTPK
ncbi:MAG: HlyD family efflux transporter periplasmic adaptor subunit [Planctomycetia bacterium]|nr:HlyD family efflux transporter periplasmic adaptor subunit [Planctomycetia bacterium]